METLYGMAFVLVLASPATALFVICMAVVTRWTTSSLRPVLRATVRAVAYVAAGGCAVVSFATLGLWLWSWRYFESFDDPTAEPMPSWVDPTIDLGLGVTGISLAFAVLVAGVTMTLTRVPSFQPLSRLP